MKKSPTELAAARHPRGPRRSSTSTEPARLLPAKRAAQYLGMPLMTLKQHVQRGVIPVVRFGDGKRARWYFRIADLDAAIERHTERRAG